MTSMIYLLRALQYPEADAFACDDEHRFRKLVLWVENRKIREYKPEDRFRLSQLDSDDWNSAFREYAEDLRCPIRFSAQARPRVLEWMIRFAISLEYGDNAEELNAFAAGLLSDRDGRGSEAVAAHASKPEVAHEMPADIKQRLERLMQLLNMDAGESSYREQASEALRKLRQVLPAAKLSRAEMQEQLDAVPLGFTTKDKQVDEAARVLRLLYIQDLLKLQTQIDQAIATVQEYTANPRTDPSLGRVGT